MRMSLLAFGAALLAVPLAGASAQTLTKIRFVQAHANVAVGEEVFLYAVPKALGYFKDEGLDVELSGAAGGVAAGQVLQAGRAEFADILAEGMLGMREQGATPLAFSSLKQNNGYSIAVLPDSPIKDLKDVAGKTIGFVAVGSGTSKILAESLRGIGVDPSFREVSVGAGPQVAVALRNKSVDAVILWEAVYGLLENQGLKLNHIELPIQNKLAGFAMASTEKYIADNPKVVAGFCRAFTKGLYFTRLNPQAAIGIFFKEFPTVKPADKDDATATKEALNVLDSWLGYAMKDVPLDAKTGKLDPAKWDFSEETYAKLGVLKGSITGSASMTDKFFDQCNDFDRKAVAEQAKAAN